MSSLGALPFLFAHVFAVTAAAGLVLGGWWSMMTVVYGIVLVPVLDPVLGTYFPPERPRFRALGYDLVLWLAGPLTLAVLVFALWRVSFRPVSVVEAIGFTMAVSLTTSIGMVAAHELVHRRRAAERGLGLLLLALAANMQYRLHHVFGHHKRIGVPGDMETAGKGENVYLFALRCYLGQHVWSLRSEMERLKRRKRAPLGPGNRLLWYLAIEGAILVVIFFVFGWWGVLFFFAQFYVATFLLNAVFYLEHYGLVRKEVAPGRYEPIAERHSWNSNHRLTNWTVYNLARHSGHHVHETIHYEGLGNAPDTPQLPTGYGGMILLAMVPPLWRKVMDPRAAAIQKAAPAGPA
jgi:alkane 1-monooxygenase